MSLIKPYRPKVTLQELDAPGGTVTGTAVDVSADLTNVELEPNVPTSTVKTFTGTFTITGDVEESASITLAVRTETSAAWAPLVGAPIKVKVWDRVDSAEARTFESEIPVDPSLYGATTPGEARQPSVDLPVLSPIEWESGVYTPPV